MTDPRWAIKLGYLDAEPMPCTRCGGPTRYAVRLLMFDGSDDPAHTHPSCLTCLDEYLLLLPPQSPFETPR